MPRRLFTILIKCRLNQGVFKGLVDPRAATNRFSPITISTHVIRLGH